MTSSDDGLYAIDGSGNRTALQLPTAQAIPFVDVPIAPGVWSAIAPNGDRAVVGASEIAEAPFSFIRHTGSVQRQNAPEIAPAASLQVNCRPVAFPYGLLADHCYIVPRFEPGETRYVGAGPEHTPAPYGENKAYNTGTMPPADAQAFITWRGKKRKVATSIIECVASNVDIWNLSHVQYDPMGPNSNTFVSWVMRECHAPGGPSILATPVGWIWP